MRDANTAAEAGPARRARPEFAVEARAEGLALLLSLLNDGAVVADARGTVVAANQAGRDLLAALQPNDTGHLVHRSLARTHRDVLADREPEEVELAIESEPRRYLRIRAAAAPAANNVLFTLRDVTEERLIHERLLQSERMASVGQLVSGVAHELNNPLTGIMGFAELLLMRDLPDQAKREVGMILDEAERAARIVQNLLTFARKRRPQKERVDLSVLVERVVELRAYDLRVHNIEPVLLLEPGLPPVLGDPHRIQQVVLNLIRNAEQAIEERGGSGTISCTTADDARWVYLTITDDGAGIAPEHLRRVFDPFFTTRGVGDGTGLGLTIAYGIIEEHGGRIALDSEGGRGATVTVQLPVAPGLPKPAGSRGQADPHGRTQRRFALVINDEPRIQQLLTTALADEGHAVQVVADATSGLECLTVRDFDLIFTKITLPGIDGIEFYRRVQTWDASVARRIIFTTDDTVNPTTRNFLEASCNPCLTKPIRIADVQRLVAAALAK